MLPNEIALNLINEYIVKFKNKQDFENKNLKKELINKLLNNNTLIKTEDGTYTLVSEDSEELMHSKIGALRESVEKFVMPSKLETLELPKILDLCSGIGYNSVASLRYNKNCKIDMVEYSKETLFLSLCLYIPFKEEHEIIKEAIKNHILKDNLPKYCKNQNQQINIYEGDARKIVIDLKKLNKKYNIVFHDGFSPQRDSVLYTVDFLKNIYELMENGGVLLSYSSSIPFRSGLIEAGFIISEGEAIGRKRGITIAYKNLKPLRSSTISLENTENTEIKRISEIDERVIALSTVGAPYRDPDFNLSHNEIINNREIERNNLKENLLKKGIYYSTKRVKLGKIPEKYLEIQKENLNSTEIIKKMRDLYYSY
jgi:tRNA U34 5-methylaminomethyl-2-thiouridine-forming methyltransferase MnmC